MILEKLITLIIVLGKGNYQLFSAGAVMLAESLLNPVGTGDNLGIRLICSRDTMLGKLKLRLISTGCFVKMLCFCIFALLVRSVNAVAKD